MSEVIPEFANYQEKIVDVIKYDSIEDFQHLFIGKIDVNRPLLKYQELHPHSKKNPDASYMCPRGPSILMFSILCERDDIVKYLIEKKNVDLGVRADGFTAFHLSTMTKDHSCFDLLMKCEYIQANIDNEVLMDGVIIPSETEICARTTALHIATSNKNYYCVTRLTSDPLPAVEYKAPNVNKEEESQIEHSTADINVVSVSGSTSLHIAVFIKDLNMVKLLLNQGADPSIGKYGNPEETPLKLAQEMLKKSSSDARIQNIVKYLQMEESERDNEATIFEACCPELSKPRNVRIGNISPSPSATPTIDDFDINVPVESEDDANIKEQILLLMGQLKKNKQSVLKEAPTNISVDRHCKLCNSAFTSECDSCKFFYCQTCFKKEKHTCNPA